MEDESESKTAHENPQEADREVQEREVREHQKAKKQAPKLMQPAKPEEGTAEWVLWMLHQNMEKGRKVLEQWAQWGRKEEVTREVAATIQGLGEEEGLEAVKELRERKQWVRRINSAAVMVPIV